MKGRKTIVSVYNDVYDTNTPLESFVRIDPQKFVLHVISLYQHEDEVAQVIGRLYPGVNLRVWGIGVTSICPLRLFGLIRLLRTIDPQVIHVHHTWSGLLSGLVGKMFTKARILMTIHSDFGWYKLYQQALLFMTYVLSDCVVCNSVHTRTSLGKVREMVSQKKSCLVCYNGIDINAIVRSLDVHDPLVERLSANNVVIGSVGRLVEAKSFDTLIRAYARVKSDLFDTHLLIIGGGPLLHELEELARELHLVQEIVFTGSLPRQRVYALLSSIDIFVVSSRWEGFCNAMVEAMAAGKPIIASRTGPLPEVLGEDGGLFFTPGNAEELAHHVKLLYESLSMRKELGQKAKTRAKNFFELGRCTRQYEDIYSTLCLTANESING